MSQNKTNLSISDEDINWAEQLLSLKGKEDIKFDEFQRKAIMDLHSKLIMACPGSGKTTMLLAKLLILERKWESPYQGICVLSYTNVAKDELIRRIGNKSLGYMGLGYPHFIGTFQSFFDTYLGLPNLRNQKIQVAHVGKEEVIQRRYNTLDPGTRNFVDHKNNLDNFLSFTKELESLDCDLSTQTPSYKKLVKYIDNSIRKGFLTYTEMKLYAKQWLKEIPDAKEQLSFRFPYVFIDECQDTTALDRELIQSFFPGTCVFQEIGDYNQQIFEDSAEDQNIPRDDISYLPNSYRFSQGIAKLSDPFAVKHIPGFTGLHSVNPEKQHTVFLFQDDTILQVGPAYCKIILESFSDDELECNNCWAVSNIIKYKDPSKKSPVAGRCLKDFFPLFSKEVMPIPSYKGKTFEEDVVRFRDILKQTNSDSYVKTIAKQLVPYLSQSSVETELTQYVHLYDFIKEQDSSFVNKYNTLFMSLIDDDIAPSDCNNQLLELFPQLAGCSYVQDIIIPQQGSKVPQSSYIYRDKDLNRKVLIHLGSIHSVKGQTHLATLVVDSFHYGYCISNLIKKIKQDKSPTIQKNMRVLFVGMTRPKELLCLAIHQNNIGEKEKDWLRAIGWNIVELHKEDKALRSI